jgi:hypothetical protein
MVDGDAKHSSGSWAQTKTADATNAAAEDDRNLDRDATVDATSARCDPCIIFSADTRMLVSIIQYGSSHCRMTAAYSTCKVQTIRDLV